MIRRVKVKNYKSLADVDVKLEPVTVLIGCSGTGKTNFVESLRFLRDVLNARNIAVPAQGHGDWSRILCATTPRPLELSFEVWFDVPGVTGILQYLLAFRFQSDQQLQSLEEGLWLDERPLFHHRGGEWVREPAVVPIPRPDGIKLGALAGMKESAFAYLVLAKGIGWYAFSENILLQPTMQWAWSAPQKLVQVV